MRLPAFFVYRRDATGTRSANCILPCATAASRTSAAPARTAVIDPKEPYTPAGICPPPPSALAKPVDGRPAQHTSQRRLATPFRHQRRECPLAREKPGKTRRKEQKVGSFRRKMRRKTRQTRGSLQTVCGIHSAHKPTPVRRSRRQEKRSALFLQRKRADRSLSGHCARRQRILVSDEVTIAQRLG